MKSISSASCTLPSRGWPGIPAGAACSWWLTASILLAPRLASAQEALRYSLAGEMAAQARYKEQESQPYNFKWSDFKMRVEPSLGFDWNDNVNISKENAEQDFILRPMLQLGARYPLTQYNLLSLSIGAGYLKYLEHDELSRWYLQSGSELSFDIYIKDFWINLHDRFEYTQDSAGQAEVASTGSYGGFENIVGLLGTGDLQDVVLTLGYDHLNFISSSSQFEYVNRASEFVVGRAGFRAHPRITAGLEGTASWTAYDQQVLNNNVGYSGGVYAEWKPGPNFRVEPRFGYTIYDFEQTSQVIKAVDQNAFYVDLSVTHEVREALSYTLNAGRELRLGIQADSIEAWYLRPSIHWKIIRNLTLRTSLFYEHGKEGAGGFTRNLAETYDWFGGNLDLSYSLIKKLTVDLSYRLTLRSSDAASREYTQNLLGLRFKYHLQ